MKGFLLAGSLLLAVRGQEAQWKALCLRLRDVPPGFHQTVSRPLTNHDLITTARFPPEVLAQIGRITGYQTEFRRTPYRPELYHIASDVSQFRSVGGAARWDYVVVKSQQEARWNGARYRLLPDVHVGDQSSVVSATASHGHYSYTTVIIYFRRGVLAADVQAEGFRGSFSLAQVVRLAQSIDTRLSAWLAHGSKSGVNSRLALQRGHVLGSSTWPDGNVRGVPSATQ